MLTGKGVEGKIYIIFLHIWARTILYSDLSSPCCYGHPSTMDSNSNY